MEIDLIALGWYASHLKEGDNITVTCDLLNVLEQCNEYFRGECHVELYGNDNDIQENDGR